MSEPMAVHAQMEKSHLSRGQLLVKALVAFAGSFVVILGGLLLAAGTIAYWQAWAYAAVLFIPMSVFMTYLIRNDPGLLERRMRTKEKEIEQGIIVKLGALLLLLAFVIPPLAVRFGWPQVTVAVVAVADVLVLLGYCFVAWVLKVNSYASRVVEVEAEQTVISTGPYAVVRHPMYVGVIVMYMASPVALGSWWGAIPALGLIPILVMRILNEEEVLARELKGYPEYMQTTRYRLIPGVW